MSPSIFIPTDQKISFEYLDRTIMEHAEDDAEVRPIVMTEAQWLQLEELLHDYYRTFAPDLGKRYTLENGHLVPYYQGVPVLIRKDNQPS